MLDNARLMLVKSCEFYRCRELDEIIEDKVREIEEYVKKHRVD